MQALENPACPRQARLYAAKHDDQARYVLLARDLDLDGEIVEQLATSIALRPGSAWEAASVAAHPLCPAGLVRGLIEQATRGNAAGRAMAAERANGAPPARREAIHEQLLLMCRKGRILDELLVAITHPDDVSDPARVAWLREHPNPRIRRCAESLPPDPPEDDASGEVGQGVIPGL
jgi:hypothetical protein